MVTIVKHEWHQTDRKFCIELDENLLSEIYPEMEEEEIENLIQQIEDGDFDVEDIINDAYNNDVELEWDFQYDDCWTDRKGGYDVTYELGDDDSWHTEPEPTPPYHKCTKCRWEGGKYETLTQHFREDGTIIEDYYNSDEESHTEKEVCPMCDSEVKFTEYGEKEEKEHAERMARWQEEEDEEEIEESYNAECTVCEWEGPEVDTLTIEGQMCCPECREPVWTAEQVSEQNKQDLNQALEELKNEFEQMLDAEDKKNK